MSPSPALVYVLVVYEELNHRLGKGIAISAATLTGTGSFALFSVQMLKALYGEKSKVDKKVECVSTLMGFCATSLLLYVLMQYALRVPVLWVFVLFLAIASTAVRRHGAKQLLDATTATLATLLFAIMAWKTPTLFQWVILITNAILMLIQQRLIYLACSREAVSQLSITTYSSALFSRLL